MSKDIGSGALLLAVAGIYWWATLQIPSSRLSDEVGAQGMPTVLAVGLAVVAALIMLRGVITAMQAPAGAAAATAAGSGPDHDDDNDSYEATLPRALGVIALGALYIAIAIFAGYIPALAVLIFTTAMYEGLKPGWRPLAVAVGGAVAFGLLFVKLLGTEQPVGLALGLLMGR